MDLAKRLYFDVPGFGRLHSTGGSIKFAGDQNTPETSDIGWAGTSREFMAGELKFKVKNHTGISGLALKELRNINVTVTDSDGKTWQCREATTTGDVTLSDGEFDMTMSFADQEEVL